MRIFKPVYEKNCNWCKHLLMSRKGKCLISNEEIELEVEILENKTCEHFKCCDCNRTLLDKIKDFVGGTSNANAVRNNRRCKR